MSVEYSILKNIVLSILFICVVIATYSQNYRVEDIDSTTVLNNRKYISYFNNIVELDDSSVLQILFIQIDNPRISKAESYYLKLDSNKITRKYIFSTNSIIAEILDTSFGLINIGIDPPLVNIIKSITGTTVYYDLTPTPSCLIIKCKNVYNKFFFLDTDIVPAVNQLPELRSAREALQFLKKHFDIKIHKMLDG